MRVRDPALAAKVAAALAPADIAARKTALAQLRHPVTTTVRRVRTVERLDGTQPIVDRRTGKTYKLVKRDSNHRAELWRLPDGALKVIVVPTFNAAREVEAKRLGTQPPELRPHPAAKLLMRLYKNDAIAFGNDGTRQVMRVVKMREGQITLAPHFEGGNLKARDAAKDDRFQDVYASAQRLRAEKAQKLRVSPGGRVLAGSAMLS